MSPILDATSLLPTGIAFDMAVVMIVDEFHEMWLALQRETLRTKFQSLRISHVTARFT